MPHRLFLFLACYWLCSLPAAAQPALTGAELAWASSKVALKLAAFPAGGTGTASANSAVRPTDPVVPLAGAVPTLLPSTLPPLQVNGRFDDSPANRFDRQGVTNSWPYKPVNREQDAFQWDGYLKSNVHMLTWQHAYRIVAQEKTRVGLRQPVLSQWGANIRAIPQSWSDGDSFTTNYVGHPLMGDIMGYLQVINHPVQSRLEFGDAGYWKARSVTLAATVVASTQFEIGPLSEASLGLNPSKQGVVDFVITPLMGTGFLLAEDAIDRYVIAKWEQDRGTVAKRVLRCALNPGRMAANLFAFRAPWSRDTRAD